MEFILFRKVHPEFYCKDFKAIAPSSFNLLIGMADEEAAERSTPQQVIE